MLVEGGIEGDVISTVGQVAISAFWFEKAIAVGTEIKIAVINIDVGLWWYITVYLFWSPYFWRNVNYK